MLGQKFSEPQRVNTLDELLLVVRKSSGVRFDPLINGYHLYGADVCLEAQKRGCSVYAIPAFCIHNTNGYRTLPWAFWRNYLRLRRKWRDRLPITTSCTVITRWGWPAILWNVDRAINLALGRHRTGQRVPEPNKIYQSLAAAGKIS